MSGRDEFHGFHRLSEADQVLNRKAEASRIEGVKAAGAVPAECGPEIPVAPARGVFRVVRPMAMQRTTSGGVVKRASGFEGRSRVEMADGFDVMAAQAARRNRDAPFTETQIAIGRFYRNLVERQSAGCVRCSSLEASTGGGSGGGAVMDARLRDSRRIDVIRKRIGPGIAMAVKRARSGRRVAITDRQLVDAVCLDGCTLIEVLRRYGWPKNGHNVEAAAAALRLALDRMVGEKNCGGISVYFSGGCPPDMDWRAQKVAGE